MIWEQQDPTPDEIAEYEAKLAEYTAFLKDSRLDRVLEWVASLLFAAAALSIWYLSNSLIVSVVVGALTAAAMSWGLIAIRRRRMNSSHEWLKANAHRFQPVRD